MVLFCCVLCLYRQERRRQKQSLLTLTNQHLSSCYQPTNKSKQELTSHNSSQTSTTFSQWHRNPHSLSWMTSSPPNGRSTVAATPTALLDWKGLFGPAISDNPTHRAANFTALFVQQPGSTCSASIRCTQD